MHVILGVFIHDTADKVHYKKEIFYSLASNYVRWHKVAGIVINKSRAHTTRGGGGAFPLMKQNQRSGADFNDRIRGWFIEMQTLETMFLLFC